MPANNVKAYEGDGRAILREAVQRIRRAGTEMSLMAEYDHIPVEHRARLREERTRAIRDEREAAFQAIVAWATRERGNANMAINASSVGSPAEETRRMANVMRVNGLVESARAAGNARTMARDYEQRAVEAASWVRVDDAEVYAQAALMLAPGTSEATRILEDMRLERDLADPTKAKAHRALNDVALVEMAARRDIMAASSASLMDAATLAKALGDNEAIVSARSEAARASIDAKTAAWVGEKAFGDGGYKSPDGVLPEGPTGPDLDGAHLPDSRKILAGGAA